MSRSELIYLLALSFLPFSRVKRVYNFIEEYTIREIGEKMFFETSDNVVPHISSEYSGNIFSVADQVIERCVKRGIAILHYHADAYPSMLKEIHHPPLVLYCQGTPCFKKSMAVVGTRKSDHSSNAVARRFAACLSQDGFTIVSGMASGIDREAHVGALSSDKPTIAVLGNGIDICYPRQNRDLYEAILQSGNSALVSEFPPGVRATRWSFVQRNRIISGLSYGTLVVQAGAKSGALTTAKYALEQNREVFVCPGHSFDAAYAGCHRLIKDGAVLVSDTHDIYAELPSLARPETNPAMEGETLEDADTVQGKPQLYACYEKDSLAGLIIELLILNNADVDFLIRKFQVSAAKMNETLTEMELSGHIFRAGNQISLKK